MTRLTSIRAKVARAGAIAALLAGLVVGLTYLGIPIAMDSNYSGLDLTRADLGTLCEMKGAFDEGRPVTVARHLAAGEPLFADPLAQALYPIRWIQLALPLRLAMLIGVALHLGLAAFGAGLLLRSFGARPLTVFFGALAYGFSGTAVDYIVHGFYIAGVTWLPWAWFFIRRALHDRRSRGRKGYPILGLAASCLMVLFAGEPQAFFWFGLVGGIECLIAAARARRRGRLRRRLLGIALVPATVVASFLVGLLQWWPTLEELRITFRDTGIFESERALNSFSVDSWLAVFAPGLMHGAIFPSGKLSYFFSGGHISALVWNSSPYLGFVIVAFAVCGFLRRRYLALTLVAVLFFLIALGENTPFLDAFIRLVPPFGKFRYPAKQFVVVNLAMTALAALSLQEIVRSGAVRTHRWAIAMVSAFGVFAIAWIAWMQPEFDRTVSQVVPRLGYGPDGVYYLSPGEFMQRAFTVALIPALGVFAVSFFRKERRWLVFLLLACDMVANNLTFVSLGREPYHFYRATGLDQVREQEKARGDSFGPDEVLCSSPQVETDFVAKDESGVLSPSLVLAYQKFYAHPQLNACAGLQARPSYGLISSRLEISLRHWMMDEEKIAWPRSLGCTIYFSRRWSVGSDERLATRMPVTVDPEVWDRVYAYRIRHPIPPVSVLTDVKWEHNPSALADWMIHQWAPGAPPSRVSLSPGATRMPELPNGRGTILKKVAQPREDRYEFELEGGGGGVVAFRRPFAMGWTATQAGKPLETVRVLAQHLGVIVPQASAGPVVLEYRIPKLREAIWAAIAGLLLILAAQALYRKTRD